MISQIECQAQGAAAKAKERFIVRYRQVPVRFVKNHCGPVYSLCHVDEATRFESEHAAREAIRVHRVNGDYCEVVKV